jgi:hypothetical protein
MLPCVFINSTSETEFQNTANVVTNAKMWRFRLGLGLGVGKAKIISYSDCFCTLCIQHAVSMHCTILPAVACLALLFFSLFSSTAQFSEKSY